MRFAAVILLAWPLAIATPAAAGPVIEFPCMKSRGDGRVLVDGDAWDEKMRALGYKLKDGEYVPWQVLGFRQEKIDDADWSEGICRLKLLPVAK